MNLQSNIILFWCIPFPDAAMPFQVHFNLFVLSSYTPDLVIPHDIILCFLQGPTNIFFSLSERITQAYLELLPPWKTFWTSIRSCLILSRPFSFPKPTSVLLETLNRLRRRDDMTFYSGPAKASPARKKV